MKKVFGSLKIGVFVCFPFYVGLWAVIKNPAEFLPGGYWYLFISFILLCGGTVLFSLKAFWAYLEMNDGRQFMIWTFTTRNYLGVLTDVVRYVQQKKQEAYIDPSVLNLVEKKSWFTFF